MPKKRLPESGIVYSTDPGFRNEDASDPAAETLVASKQLLKIRFDNKHRSGKAVTLVEGFEGRTGDLEALGKQLKTFCGAGGSVKDNQIIIQGDHRGKVLQWLKKNGYDKAAVK